MVLSVGLIGAMVAARRNQHISIDIARILPQQRTIRAEEGLDDTSKIVKPCPPGLRKRIKRTLKDLSEKHRS